MAKEKMMKIAFPRGGIIAGAVLGKSKDVHVPPHEGVNVPYDYGQQLIDDKFAVEFTGKAPNAPQKSMSVDPKAVAAFDAARKKLDEDRTAFEKSQNEAVALLVTDQKALDTDRDEFTLLVDERATMLADLTKRLADIAGATATAKTDAERAQVETLVKALQVDISALTAE